MRLPLSISIIILLCPLSNFYLLFLKAAELRTRPDVVVGTPGRLLDHLTNSAGVDLDDLEFLILDEADRLLDL